MLYCNLVYVGLLLYFIRELQLEHNKTAGKLVTGADYCQHLSPLQSELHWLPIWFWLVQGLVLIHEALNSLGPKFLKEHLIP